MKPDQHRDYADDAIGALFRHAIADKPFPEILMEAR